MQAKTIKTGPSISVGHLRRASVRIVKIMDASISEVFQYSAFRTDRLDEWWFIPETRFAWSEGDLTDTDCRDHNQLVAKLLGDEMYQPCIRTIQGHICALTVPGRSMSDLRWDFSTRLVDGVGTVISIICGDEKAFASFMQMKRERTMAHANT